MEINESIIADLSTYKNVLKHCEKHVIIFRSEKEKNAPCMELIYV